MDPHLTVSLGGPLSRMDVESMFESACSNLKTYLQQCIGASRHPPWRAPNRTPERSWRGFSAARQAGTYVAVGGRRDGFVVGALSQ
jgi:hypothetical protein